MPLQIDSLIASKIESQTITIQGAPASVLPTYIGDIYADKQFTTIAQTETAIETLLVPANFLSGLQDSVPYFNIVTETSTIGYTNLVLRVYVSPTSSFNDGVVLYQETFEDAQENVSPVQPIVRSSNQQQLNGVFLSSILESNFSISILAIKYENTKISIIGNLDRAAQAESTLDFVISPDLPAKASGYQVSTFDNFDVTTNQYLIVTAENSRAQIGIKTIFVGLKNSYNGLYANEIPAAQA